MTNPHADRLIDFLVASGIQDQNVINAIYALPRERFVSQAMVHQAYDNNALPIGQGQTISQPYIVAKMTEMLELRSTSKVLEVGTGSGYQTAVLAQLVDHVYSIERIKSLQWEAKRRLKQLDIYNVSTKHGDGWQGWAVKGPFDAIIVTAAAASVPPVLLEQLSDGGILVIPVGEDVQQLLKITRQGDEFLSQIIEDVRFVPLIAGELA
ncbi:MULTISPECIES: protein-L-isoaspartate(D-aspartate) O-methyltransferase [Vibrio]|jgi:protein-L-isoaspartate(D-aspartate) O-methyltransferase|uniref:Protein-L-isoaspartate O-methyltransferase n=1 Tax=Vibrio coralliilyticus TaxID=190893 RepID=A0AAN0VYA3_9VIBR|nr:MULTISPECIES: protein-L-isoaspartate(D-aspartate) O-methyltransferase [Vibrio]AIW19913.1 protein-L-isoaspartate O-methyltransferase [Vibrio coralliilyticus]AXN31564.1 protein-L-isoaspartate(D-aspartate) O-methyltransferase [Vibrio coralliilyticus]KFI09850.1 protein-L-isoaspartate O-methyltransferase [Vibrio sp. B183]KPH27942.1 protein-L-isoaspartate O-methyltransferase [Vibrio coralliilyticus]NOH40638.1 protein-L-isoaspartate(D-aspartate) O-methyltransferase [Vibrio coralliilyticus]